MSINIGPATTDELRPKITVIGVGGAGGNAIGNMIENGIEGVDFVVANTDAQALNNSAAEARVQLGPEITGGLGAGSRPEVGKAAAEETASEIEDLLEGVNMCFIAAGMGGGTGTGAAPVIAEAARNKGVLTVGVVTKPFLFEGTRRMRAAEAGIEELQRHVDTLIVIPNQNLFLVAKADTTFKQAFQLADEVLQQGVRSITDLMVMPGLINLDFADVKSVMEEMGKAMMGTGEGEGENRALEAAERAIANPLLDGVSMAGAKGVIISIIGGEDMKLLEVDEAANHIRELVDENANIIWGSAFNPDLDGKIRVSVVATGIERSEGTSAGTSQSMSLGSGRAPRRPVLDLPSDDMKETEAEAPAEEPAAVPAGIAGLGLSAASAGSSYDDEDEYDEDDDVDGIVDPLAGLRKEEDDDTRLVEPASDDQFGVGADDGFAGDSSDDTLDLGDASNWDDVGAGKQGGASEEPLDLGGSEESAGTTGQDSASDDLLRNADRLSEQDAPVQGGRRRQLVSGGDAEATTGQAEPARAPAAPAPSKPAKDDAGGSTLFERMANLSRGSSSKDDDDDDDDDGGSLSIPRFLGRQNNQ
ncbi:cell division protein FtsZ [Erythrobacteraceae bacterium WH01K]|nr:cell division protein FtsZ [Erythrobacteraceae bacterium WH01K]